MIGPHTRTPWLLREQGDANQFAILTGDGKEWVLGLLHNGEPLPEQQLANLRHIVHCVNVHDELLQALLAFRDGGPHGGRNFTGWHESYAPAIDMARAAIAKATGSAS